VLTSEPPREGNVLLDLELPNLIVTPHVAWASQEAMQLLADQLIDKGGQPSSAPQAPDPILEQRVSQLADRLESLANTLEGDAPNA